jgi:hypothetical protein
MTLSGLGLVSTTYGAQLTEATTTLSDSTFAASSTYTITHKFATASAFRSIKYVFANSASTGSTIPTGMATNGGSVAISAVTYASDVLGDWSLDKSTNGTLIAIRSSSSTPASGDPISITFDAIANPSSSSACDGVTNSDSCFVRISTHSSADGTGAAVDQTTATFTVGDVVTATATVDPILTFTVAGVTNSNINTNDTNTGGGTTVTSTATTLPFGNVTVGTAKKTQQQLTTLTNANNGYNVYGKFTEANVMKGSASSSNNIDKFSAAWSSPAVWASPTGTAASVNSAWLGVRTSDSADISGFNTSDYYAGPDVSGDSGVGKVVMKSTTPDNGSTSVYVTFKIEANAYQPADSYSGIWRYTVVPSY